jgi:protease I
MTLEGKTILFFAGPLYEDLEAANFDGLVIPGGYAPDIMRRSKKLLQLTREIYEAGKPVAFICHAGWVPISAGIVRGKRGTSVGAIKDDLVNAGMLWDDSPVVVDGISSPRARRPTCRTS